jgi:hypothetical protein
VRPVLGAVTLPLAALFVVVSQIKINTTNAYSGSLSFANFFSRVLHRHPGRAWYVLVNCGIALALMEFGAFAFLNNILGFYSNVAIAWIGAVVADLVICKPLGWSPPYIEFKRAYLYAVNPVGFGSMVLASLVSVVAYFGAFGPVAAAWSPFIALALAMVAVPVMAKLTGGKYYLARPNLVSGPESGAVDLAVTHMCEVCEDPFELPDIVDCVHHGGAVCSLCCTLESACGQACQQSGPVLVPLSVPAPRDSAP